MPGGKATYAIILLCLAGCEEVGLDLSYDVTISETGQIDVEMGVAGVGQPELELKTYEHKRYLGLSDISAATDSGLPLEIRENETEAGLLVFTVLASGAEDVRVSYSVKPGRAIGGGHGRHPTSVSGYTGDDFGLVSGRNLFVVPEALLDSIRVHIKPPVDWMVVTTWSRRNEGSREFFPYAYNGGPEDLLNGTVGVGALRVYERLVVGTPLRIAVYDDWSHEYKEELVRRVSDLYEYVTSVMEAPIAEAYTVILTPKTADGLNIRTFGTTHGQGREMWPPTTTRWMAVTEQMMYRWLRYAPFRMELARIEDMWFVDGAAVYYAVMGVYETGIIESVDLYITEAYRQYNSNRLSQFKRGVVPATLYTKSSSGRERLLREWGLMFTHFMDESIVRKTGGEADLRHVLRQGYQKRKDVDLIEIMKESTSLDIGFLYPSHIQPSVPPKIPMWYRKTRPPGTEPAKLPLTRGSVTPKDTLTLILTGRTRSFLEACGCKANMSGGITRRATLISQIMRHRESTLVIDSGDLFPATKDVPRMDDLTSTELDTYLGALDRMGYSFAAIAGNEVSYGGQFLKRKVRYSPIPMISANVLYDGRPVAPPTIVLESGEHRFGFIGLFQEKVDFAPSAFSDNTWDVEIADPKLALRPHLA